MILFVDNFDSFSYILVDYFKQLEVPVRVVRNNEPLDSIHQMEYTGIVLSPGPETPEKSGNLMNIIDSYHNRIPMLGICLGHQAIGQYFGAKIIKASIPMHGKISKIFLEEDPLFSSIPSRINVVRYHSLLLDELPKHLLSIAASEKNEIMAIKHVNKKIWGVQFHPEAYLTEYGMDILKNWLNCIN